MGYKIVTICLWLCSVALCNAQSGSGDRSDDDTAVIATDLGLVDHSCNGAREVYQLPARPGDKLIFDEMKDCEFIFSKRMLLQILLLDKLTSQHGICRRCTYVCA